jgi:rRNA maturation endonuclease Nob1
MNKEQLIFRNGCWGCKRAIEDPKEEYICPSYQQHLREYENYEATRK